MTRIQHPLELLAPAKNADFGIEAIRHGADAVYIGGPAFGARYGAGNDVAEIRRLCDFAHRYRAKVFVTVNTILHDAEHRSELVLSTMPKGSVEEGYPACDTVLNQPCRPDAFPDSAPAGELSWP